MDPRVKQQIEHPVEDAFDPEAAVRDLFDSLDAAQYPDGNPKTALGLKKPPMQYVPPVAMFLLGQAFKDGAIKYGPMNWREKGVTASVYYDAMMRHAMSWWDGENVASDSKVHHLAHVMACCAIIIDAELSGTCKDDRPAPGSLPAWIKEWLEESA